MLDEPVSALDVASRADVLRYLGQVLERFAVRSVYVSHDLREAARLANEMLWMERGKVVAQGVARDVLTDVRLPFAELDEAESLLDGVIEGHDAEMGLTRIRCADTTLWLTQVDAPVGSSHRVQIAARDVSLALCPTPGAVSVLNVLEARVSDLLVGAPSAGTDRSCGSTSRGSRCSPGSRASPRSLCSCSPARGSGPSSRASRSRSERCRSREDLALADAAEVPREIE